MLCTVPFCHLRRGRSRNDRLKKRTWIVENAKQFVRMSAAAASFLAGCAAGGFAAAAAVSHRDVRQTGGAGADTVRTESAAPVVVDEAEIENLRKRVRDLERECCELIRRRAEREAAAKRIARLGENDRMIRDEEEVAKRLDTLSETLAKSSAAKLDILDEIDISMMSNEQIDVHNHLKELLDAYNMKAPDLYSRSSGLSEAERKALAEEVHLLAAGIKSAGIIERSNLIELTARALGCDGEEASELADLLYSIRESTDASQYLWTGNGAVLSVRRDGSAEVSGCAANASSFKGDTLIEPQPREEAAAPTAAAEETDGQDEDEEEEL